MSGREAGEARAPAKQWVGLLLLFSCIIVWGINAVAFKLCIHPPHGAGFDPVFFTGLRFLCVAPCMAFLVWARGRGSALRMEKGDLFRYLGFGFVAIVLGETLQPLALHYTSVANLTLLSHGTLSLFTALWAFLLFRQRIARTGQIGALLAAVGVAIVAGSAPVPPGVTPGLHFGGATWRGDAIALFRSVEHSLYLLMLSRWLQKRSVLQVTVYNCTFGALWLLPYVLYRGIGFSWSHVALLTWAAFAWTVVPATLYAFLTWNWGLRQVGAVPATNMFYLMPFASALSAWAILGEPITHGQALGGMVIILGVVLLRWDILVEAGVLRFPETGLRSLWRK